LEPVVLLLDEPLGALDLRLRVQMQEALKDIQRDSLTTFVYVTHDQTEALAMSDRIAIMNDGVVLQVGSPSEIYEQPASRFVAQFVGDTNLIEGRVDSLGTFRGQNLEFRVQGDGDVVSIRPQYVAMGHDLDRGRLQVFTGRVEETVYLGSVRRYRVRLTPQLLLLCEVANSGSHPAPSVGEEVQVGWEPARAVVLTN
jgi:ABC-type Fe3+/spermidine/putrescine transport system ATPase subunit